MNTCPADRLGIAAVVFACVACLLATSPDPADAACTEIEGGTLKIKPAAGSSRSRFHWKARDKAAQLLLADPRTGTTTLELRVGEAAPAQFSFGLTSAAAWRGSGSPPRAWTYRAKHDPASVPGIDTIRSRHDSFLVKGKDGVIDQIVAPIDLPVRITVTDSAGACFTTEFRECTRNDFRSVKCKWTPTTLPEVPDLVFQSGFEPDTNHVFVSGTPAPCTDDILGEDHSVNGRGDWQDDLEQTPFGPFKFCFGGGDRTQRSLDLVVDPEDPSNQVLYGRIVEPNENVSDNNTIACDGDPQGSRKARIHAVMNSPTSLTRFDYRMRVRLGEAGLAPVVAADSEINWFTLAEFWNNLPAENDTFRITLNAIKQGVSNEPLRFGVKADKQNDGSSTWHRVWPSGWPSSGVEVPLGEWFTLDFSIIEGNGSTGRVTIRMTDADGEVHTIADITNWTRSPDGVADGFSALNPLKLYTSGALMCALADFGLPLEIWWDDFAIGSPD